MSDRNCGATISGGGVCWLPPHVGGDHDFHYPGELSGGMDLAEWWRHLDTADWEAFGPKLAEYGARDLIAHGRAIESMRDPKSPAGDAYLGEVGCVFYLHGKLARAMEAYGRGMLPSDDTLKDIETYARMARAFRERGSLA